MICLIHVVAGKLFHTRGSATAKLQSPRVARVRATAVNSNLASEEFSRAAGETASNRFSITAMLSPFPTLLTKED